MAFKLAYFSRILHLFFARVSGVAPLEGFVAKQNQRQDDYQNKKLSQTHEECMGL
jgi:hypothetical protein